MHNHLIPVLQEDHAVLQELVHQAQSNSGGFRERQRLTNDLYLSLSGHIDIVEHTVLPILRTATGDSLPDMFSQHCDDLRDLLSDLIARRTDSAALDATLVVLDQALALQTKREAMFLLPALDRALHGHAPLDVARQDDDRFSATWAFMPLVA